jgi:hypothetical protein
VRLRLGNLGDGVLHLLGMAARGLPECIEPGVQRRAFGFGPGLRAAGGGEVGLGLTARLAGLPVGMIEVGQALDPDLVRLPRFGRLDVGLSPPRGQGDSGSSAPDDARSRTPRRPRRRRTRPSATDRPRG